VLRLYVPKQEDMATGWRRLDNEELCILRVITSPSIKWAGHVARM